MMKPIIVRGGGDLATGTIYRLSKSGYLVIVLESQKPSAIRRQVSFCQAVYEGIMEVEGMACTKVESIEKALETVEPGKPVLLVDDIYTTGSTANAIAGKLKAVGVKNVYVLTLCIGKGI